MTRKILTPNEDHPITVTPCPHPVTMAAGTLHIARTHAALTLAEAAYPDVQYVPRADVDMSLLERSEHTTYCPYKGVANYYSIPALGNAGRDSVWTYETPREAVRPITGHLAFYADRACVEVMD